MFRLPTRPLASRGEADRTISNKSAFLLDKLQISVKNYKVQKIIERVAVEYQFDTNKSENRIKKIKILVQKSASNSFLMPRTDVC